MSSGLVEKSFVNNDELFYLKWNNFQKNVSTQFEKLREDDDLVDITFACEGRMLTAHKLVLFACSPYFKELLKKNPSPHPVFFMNDVKYDVLKAILQYMYLGEVHITNENLKEFIKTAEGLQIRGLSKENNALSNMQGDLIIPPNHQDALRRDAKSEQMLDEFCRKRTDLNDLQSSSVLNIKRVKTGPDGSMSTGAQDGSVSNVEPKVEMVEYLDSEAATHQSPTYCSMDTYADKNNPRNPMGHLGTINNAGFAQTAAAPVSGSVANQPGASGSHGHNVHEYKSEDDSSWMEKSLDNISVNSEQSMKYNSGGGAGGGSGGSSGSGGGGNSDKSKQGRSSRSSNRSADDKANCLTPRCCPVCSRLYSNVSNLRQHMRLIHNPTAVCCPICQKHFNSELYLKRHYSSIHSINPNGTGDGDLVDTKPPSSQLQQQQQPPQQQQQQQQGPQPTPQQQVQQQQQQQVQQQQAQQQQQQQVQQQQPQQAPAPTANTWNPYHHHDASQLVNPFIK